MRNLHLHVPLVVINFLTDNVYLLKGEVMSFMQDKSLNIPEIVTETSTEPSSILLEEDNDIEGLPEQKEKSLQKIGKRNLLRLQQT